MKSMICGTVIILMAGVLGGCVYPYNNGYYGSGYYSPGYSSSYYSPSYSSGYYGAYPATSTVIIGGSGSSGSRGGYGGSYSSGVQSSGGYRHHY